MTSAICRILLVSCLWTLSIDAQERKEQIFELNIPVQSLSNSLNQLSDATQTSIIFPFDLTEGKQGSPLEGQFTLLEALNKLLAGSNLEGRLTDKNFVVISQIAEQKKQLNGKNNMKAQKTTLAKIFTLLFGTIGSTQGSLAQVIEQQQQANSNEIEIIEVVGIKGSLKDSLNDKRFASEIMDTISAEDIGQLPDENIAEALQRITGVQMARSADGEGSTLQIRGISSNNVQINGQIVSGSDATRSVNFQDLNSEIFSSVQIFKAPTAAQIEGSLGGTVNLKTRKPLNGKQDFFASVNGSVKYAEIAEETDPALNAFFKYNFRNTDHGDFGVLFNVSTKTVTSVAEAYGGGDFDDAPAIWARRTANQAPPAGGNNANGANRFHPSRGAGIWAFDPNLDVNGDGASDDSDIYYLPNAFGFFNNFRQSDRNTFNATLQWQPNDKLDIYLDTTLTQIEETSRGSRYSINFNAARTTPLSSGTNNFELLNSTSGLGDVYIMSSGRLGAATSRLGASPSLNVIERDSEAFNFGLTWQASERLVVKAELSTSDGEANTIQQGALTMGIDYNGNGALTGSDFAQFVDFNLDNGGRIPDAILYESPFIAPAFGQTENATSLPDVIDPTDANYERLSYFQFNRVANDTKNGSDAFRIDFDYEIDDSPFTSIEFGIRRADREFKRTGYQNGNQRNGPSSLFSDGGDLRNSINVQAIRVNPASLTNPELVASSEFLQQCLEQGGSPDLLSDEPSNLPRTWTVTTCGPEVISQAFGLVDIRDINENTGAGRYERTGLSFDVQEKTNAAYIMANFSMDVGDFALYGNVGTRYVRTETSSTGFVRNPPATLLESVTLNGKYKDLLPSLNANLAINPEMLLRLGLSRSLGRPSLAFISPGVTLFPSEEVAGFDGTAVSGNPNLNAIKANNVDISYEWYYNEASAFSVAYFSKNISSIISRTGGQFPIQIGDETYLTTAPSNLAGTSIRGVEVSLQHAFDSLPGLFSHTGVGINYTKTDEDSDLIDQEGDPVGRRNLSEDSYNLTAYYDDGKLSIRLAYNWRDEFVRREGVRLGFGRPEQLPEIEAARGQLDFNANYVFNKNLKVNFNIVNLNESETERFMKYSQLTNYIANAGRRFSLGATYRF